MLPLDHNIQRHGVSFHCCANGTQLSLPVRASDPGMLSSLHDCLQDVKNWMSQLNSDKTEITVIGPQHWTKQPLPSAGFSKSTQSLL